MQKLKDNSIYAQAFAYMADGYSVIPIRENKRPLVQWKKYQKERADEEQIDKWWSKYPEAGVGIVTGEVSGITVVDIDVKNEKKTSLDTFPKTRTVKTPSGGYHLYYKHSDAIGTGANQFAEYPHVDIRNDGGYVLAPPTSGYELHRNEDIEDFPVDMFPIQKKRKKTGELVNIGSGKRNDSIASMIGKTLATTSMERWVEDAWPVIIAVNKTYSPPLSEDELKRTFQSIAKKEKERRQESVESPIQLSNVDSIKYQLRKNKNNTPHKDMTNAVFAIQASEEYGGKIKFDTFSGHIEIHGHPKSEENTLEIQRFLQNKIDLNGISRQIVEDAIQMVGFENKYDSAVEYIQSLKWDGTPRVDEWLSYTYKVESNEYTRSVGSNWLRALVKRIIYPGTKFDNVLVIEGDQEIKKSLSLSILGGDWHVETSVNSQDKDFLLTFQGRAIVEMSEGETLSRSEVKNLKSLITREKDVYRAPYGRYMETHPRRFVFAMTTNEDSYLKDETGNRRWWPIRVPKGVVADTEWLVDNRDQLFAECYQRLEEPTWKVPKKEVEEEQESRRITSEMEEQVVDWYVSLPNSRREEGVTVKNFLEEWLYKDELYRIPKDDRMLEMRIGGMYRAALKLEKRKKQISGVRKYRYYPTEKTPKHDPNMVQKDDFEDW